MKYYSLESIIKTNSVYHVIFGERSNGKTYAVLKHGLENFLNGKGQIGIIRRWKEDITGRRAAQMWESLIVNDEVKRLSQGRYTGICYWAGKWFCCVYDDEGKPVYNVDTDCLGYAFSLSDIEHNKSISYPNITTVLFDEFITNRIYFPDEFIIFMNTISSIVRQRTNVKIFMCGNTVNKFNPYFEEMGLKHASKMEQGSIDVYTYGNSELKVAVEYCASLEKQKKNNFYFAFDNPKLNMITSGAWELDLFPHLPEKYTPSQVKFNFFILFNDNIYHGEIVRGKSGDMFIYIHQKTTEIKNPEKELIYSLDYNYHLNYNRSIWKPTTQIQKRIQWFFSTDRVFYQNNEVGNAIQNYLKVCGRS